MEILIVSQYWEPENGVPQRRWAWLTRELVEAGHSVFVIAPYPHYLNEGIASQKQSGGGVVNGAVLRQLWVFFSMPVEVEIGENGESIYRSRFIPAGHSISSRVLNQASVALGQLLAMRAVRRRAANAPFGVTIGTVPALPTAMVAYLISRYLKTKFAIDLRDAWPDLLKFSKSWNAGTGRKSLREKVLTKGPVQLLTALSGAMLNFCLRRADGIVVTSEYLEHELSRRFPKPRGNYATVRNAFPVESEVDHRPFEGVHDRPLRMLYAGTLGRAQNLRNAIDAVELLQAEGVAVHLKLVGGGAARDYLKARAEESPAMVEVLPRKSSDELLGEYQWADTALVHLTDWEPLDMAVPSKLYELLENGIYISAVVSGEPAELVRSLDSGVVVDPENPRALADAWRDLLSGEYPEHHPEKGREWVRTQREEVAPRELLKFLNEVCGESTGILPSGGNS